MHARVYGRGETTWREGERERARVGWVCMMEIWSCHQNDRINIDNVSWRAHLFELLIFLVQAAFYTAYDPRYHDVEKRDGSSGLGAGWIIPNAGPQ